jgi:hypothetical protein
LWPASGGNDAPDWHQLIHYWFVQYNPLYFFSALCVLAGVYLLALELDGNPAITANGDWSLAQMLLFAVIQLYELLLIAAAGFLVHKVGLVRPAVILTLLEGVFLFDCTFRLETISHLGITGTVLTVAWVVLIPVKVWLLGRALRLKVPLSVIGLAAGGGAGLALMMQSLGMPGVDRSVVILAVTWWGAALIACAVTLAPRISRADAPDDASDSVCARIAKSLLLLLGGIYFYHVLNYITWIGVDDHAVMAPMIGTIFLLFSLLRPYEREIWLGIVIALLASLPYPAATFPMCLFVTGILLYQARQSGNARFVVGAVLSAYLATWTFAFTISGHLPPPPVWSTVLAAALLGYLAWKLRELTAFLALAAGGLLMAVRYDFNPLLLLPQSRLSTGILLVAVGFLALTVGVGVNWWFRSPTPSTHDDPDDAGAPLDASEAGA